MRRDVVLIPLYLWVSASILLHVVSKVGITEVAGRIQRARQEEARNRRGAAVSNDMSPAEVEFVYVRPQSAAGQAATMAPVDPTRAIAAAPSTTPERSARVHAPTPRAPVPAARVSPRPATAPRPVPTIATRTEPVLRPPPPRERANMQHVDQRNPREEARPQDPAFLAQSNRDVREQTQAALRNLNRDHPDPQVGGAPSQSAPGALGNSARNVSADDRRASGDRQRVPEESRTPPTRAPSTPRVSNAQSPGAGAPSAAAGAPRSPGQSGRSGTAGQAGLQGAAGASGAAGATGSVLTGSDGAMGSIALGGGGAGGAGGAGTGAGGGGQGGTDGNGAPRASFRGLGAAGALAALTPNFATYSQVFGQTAERERRMAEQRRSQARGSYSDSWRENRAAIENYVPGVRVGNTTALRTAHSPFSEYLTEMHRRIHRLFADGFLSDLERQPPDSPLRDESLVSTLEIVLRSDGSIQRLGVVRTSGNTAFDVASLNSVRRAAPFGTAPNAILSGDGRVYIHWGFYRNERQCGTFNAEPYILPRGGGSPPRTPDVPPARNAPSRESTGSDALGSARRTPSGSMAARD